MLETDASLRICEYTAYSARMFLKQIAAQAKFSPDKSRLRKAIADAGLRVRDAIRDKQPEYRELGLDDPSLSDEVLLDAMVATPVLINRPFVFTPMGARLCRPDSSRVLDILPPCDKPFAKEDGEVVIDENGKRVR